MKNDKCLHFLVSPLSSVLAVACTHGILNTTTDTDDGRPCNDSAPCDVDHPCDAEFHGTREQVSGSALLKYWQPVNRSAPTLEEHRFFPNNPRSVYETYRLDYRNMVNERNWWSEGEIGDKENNQYGKYARVQGYIVPRASGVYQFHVAGRERVAFSLSSDTSPLNAIEIANADLGTDYQQWSKYPSQVSSDVVLESGKKYYFELKYDSKKGAFSQDQSFSVAWSGPEFKRRIIGHADMDIYWPYKDPIAPARGTGGFQGEIGTWVNVWNTSMETWWSQEETSRGSRIWIDGAWQSIDWTNLNHINDALNQLVEAGVDFLILDCTNGLWRFGIARSIQMMASRKGLKIAIARDHADRSPDAADALIWNKLVQNRFFGANSYLRVDGKPLVVVYAIGRHFDEELARTDRWTHAFTYVSADGYRKGRELWGWQLRSEGAIPSGRGMFVSGAIKPHGGLYAQNSQVMGIWRNSIALLDYNFLLARKTKPQFIIAGSWDDAFERNNWAKLQTANSSNPSQITRDVYGDISDTALFERVVAWIDGVPDVVEGGLIRDGAYSVTNENSGYALRVRGDFDSDVGHANGHYTNIEAYLPGATLTQDVAIDDIHGYVWFYHLGNNEYKILPAYLGLPLQAATNSNEILVDMSENTDAQRWIAREVTANTYTFESKATGKVMEVHGSSPDLQAEVGQGDHNDRGGQKWILSGVSSIPDNPEDL